ncbi:MAG: tRNA (adenosine(37)-N6)-dimethylallyltransferase MiaA [Planctomycetaceae bacterium]|jgi:tRNA dimethylallyltransferase|nr:tRNA (adenosine(37)-N6)-dimethylallyltransferase MiaA [Planctomycetaceae bacterium]
MTNFREHIFITGATASGKTAVGLTLAERIGGEIVSLDSMAVYRGMEIGTAVPNADELKRVRHHLIGIVEPVVEYSVADYLRDAAAAVNDICSRGKRVIFVGGTALYLKTMLRGFFDAPPANVELRKALADEAAMNGQNWLHGQLAKIDPTAAAKLHPNDSRRLIRAIEVYRTTGRTMSDWQCQFDKPVPREECRVFVIDRERKTLYERIDKRVDKMMDDGLLDEARRLQSLLRSVPDGLTKSTASQALGYRELFGCFDGKSTMEESLNAIKTHTRQFAKRQLTWFRSLSECRFVQAEKADGTILSEADK